MIFFYLIGCTIIEMATGKCPFIEAGPEIIFKVGYYKEHPIIPDDMSEKAKNFILKCFEGKFENLFTILVLQIIKILNFFNFKGDPDKRLTADQLLEEPFLSDPKENRKKPPTGRHSTNNQATAILNSANNKNGYFEFNRSTSLPSGDAINNNMQTNTLNNNNNHIDNLEFQLSNGVKSTKIARFTSNEERNQDKKNQNLKLNIKSANNQKNYHQNNGFLNVGNYANIDADSNSPSIVLTPNSFDESPQLSRKQRGTSSDIMCSPPVTDSTVNGGSSDEHFFVVKKEGQRRATLYQIMTENSDEICEAWHSNLEKVTGQLHLEKADLNCLLNGLRSCINGDNDEMLFRCLKQMKDNQLEKGHQLKEVIKEIKNALYSVREPMNNILRTRNIKPHWIFSLDNLINNVVYKALSAFSKEDYSSSDESDSDNNQVAYTSNSQDLRRLNLNTNKLNELDSFNYELWDKLIRQEIYLKNILIQNLKRKTMTTNDVELLNHPSIDYLINDDYSDRNSNSFVLEPSTAQSDKSVSFSNFKRDDKLIEWLKSINCDNSTIRKFIEEELTYENVLKYMDKDHLKRLRLKIGVEITIWNAIEQTRLMEKQREMINDQIEEIKPESTSERLEDDKK